MGSWVADRRRSKTSPEVRVAGGLQFSRIQLSSTFSCGLTTEAKLYCWGQNSSGELGFDGVSSSNAPVQVPLPEPVVAFALGAGHVCALAARGALLCWGANFIGEVGDGSTAPRRAPVRVVDP